ncbi:Arc family DNA-binding protein [Mesorhizobium sp. KR1-2]|uniref:Arc family DNA-binding protein n=1 Tax=Mesorhizobium sp. KR1-2 TaxID=3156609 RepID=UPI0032B4DA35
MHIIKPYGLRMPDELRNWLAARAKKARRSMNSELLLLLEAAKQADQEAAA